MDWVFDAGRPCLHLVNTLRSRHLPAGVELLTSTDALAEWLDLAGFGRETVTGSDLKKGKSLREAVNRLLTAEPLADDVRLVNDTLKAAPKPPRLRLENGTLHREVPTPANPVATALAELAADAVDLATGSAKVRICAADDCGLRFVDTSPRRTRQWCSMARCGNRAKARAHYERTKNR
ncbi:CGNR zinc finger domain-containing protein [Amycolatopsis jejuensis]|uniref:CGNR zinc finger domain-containing protein n=1 Tax=Amycolatopsis jejuensis TaxID=330084 RepID=UPI00052691D5|nr:CGNR zinc finger domain-containing protein [Amycolatopsis jejuensis]